MSIKIGASGALFCDRFTLDCHVVETRQYPYRVSDCWGVTQKAINNGIYLIFNICWESDYNPTDEQWRHRVEQVVLKLIAYGGNKNNCRITIINEPMKFISKEKYAHLINIAYSQVKGRFLVGSGNEEFALSEAKGGMYQYILSQSNFDILDIHIQGSCLTEANCNHWCAIARSWAMQYGKILDCTEANYSDVTKESGYKTLLMQLSYAEQVGCINFPMVFIGLSNEEKYRWLSFIYDGKVRSSYWENFKKLMKEKAPIPSIEKPIIIGDDDMKLKILQNGSKGNQVKWLQKILLIDYHVPNPGGIDGSFGSLTDKQVRDWQEEKEIKIDGLVGLETTTKLLEESSDPKKWMRLLQILMAYE